jgi:SAM-dependent methyltransferase
MDLLRPLKAGAHRFGNWYIERICNAEADSQVFTRHNERLIEFGFALRALRDHRPKTVLDIGTGTTAWPHLLRNCGFVVEAIDNVRDYWPTGMVNRHWPVTDVDILKPTGLRDGWEAITCISVLEHIADHETAVSNMARLLAPGGKLVLTTPYSEHNPYPNVYKHPDAIYGQSEPYICRSSSHTELERWLRTGLRLEYCELWKLFTGPVWDTGEFCSWELAKGPESPHQLGCFIFRKD